MKVILVDDHNVVRLGLQLLLSGWKAISVIGAFESAEEMFEKCKDFSKADLVILDEQLIGIKGSDAVKLMRKNGIETPVILLSVEDEVTLQKKVTGVSKIKVLNKTIAPDALRASIKSFTKPNNKFEVDMDDPVYLRSKITNREMIFLRHLCHEEEFTYDQIADIMEIHVRTVDGFRKSLFRKLNIKSKTGLVMMAIRNKWV
jgi:two-component system invasion response regulator UvrY